ncbi:hypothetical protein TNCV_676661 [Trichonephila clavipes]|nr:hypothetical protein TNCV_676661 [Trichonephila clavipes]
MDLANLAQQTRECYMTVHCPLPSGLKIMVQTIHVFPSQQEVDFVLNPDLPRAGVLEFAYFTNPITVEAYTILSGKKIQEAGFFLYFSVLNNSVNESF